MKFEQGLDRFGGLMNNSIFYPTCDHILCMGLISDQTSALEVTKWYFEAISYRFPPICVLWHRFDVETGVISVTIWIEKSRKYFPIKLPIKLYGKNLCHPKKFLFFRETFLTIREHLYVAHY